jgi:hypothetical protein
MITWNAVPPMILATILASVIAADAKPITEAEKKHCATPRLGSALGSRARTIR